MVCVSCGRNRREFWSRVWLFVGFKVEWWPRGQQVSISRTHKRRFRVALASAGIAFLMASSQVSFWQSFCFAWVQMEGPRPSRNRQIKTGFEIIVLASNSWKTVYKYSRWAALSITSSNQCKESFLIVLQMVSTKAVDSPRLWQKKALNLSQLIRTLIWSPILRRCCCHWNKAVFFKKITANKTWFGPMAPVVAKWSLRCWKKL